MKPKGKYDLGFWTTIRIDMAIEKDAFIRGVYELLNNKPSSNNGTFYKDQFLSNFKINKKVVITEMRNRLRKEGTTWGHPIVPYEEPTEEDFKNRSSQILDWYRWQAASKIAYDLFPEWFDRSNSVKFINDR